MSEGLGSTQGSEISAVCQSVGNMSPLKLKCPACGIEGGSFPNVGAATIECTQCHYKIIRDGDCWDACVDKSYPREFARQWVLWEQGRLGNPDLVYGRDPKDRFHELLQQTSLKAEQLTSMKILEVAYGHGRLLRNIQQYSPTAYGIDLAKPLKSANLRPGSTIFGNLLNIPLMPHQFDLVICRGVIHCTPNPQESFRRVAEQVAENGLLYVAGLYEPDKGNLILRKILPWSWHYPEFVQLGLANVLSLVRATIEAGRTKDFSSAALKRSHQHYKLDVFDIISPRWTAILTDKDVMPWFVSQGFQVRKVGWGNYLGVKSKGARGLKQRGTLDAALAEVMSGSGD